MKKIILIFTTILIVVSSLLLFVSARDNEDYSYVLEFRENTKAYPIMNGLENSIGFGEYYGTKNFNFTCYPDEYGENQLYVTMINGNLSLKSFSIGGSYPTFDYTIAEAYKYSDIAFCRIDNEFYIVGLANEGYKVIIGMSSILMDDYNTFMLDNYVTLRTNLRDGYRVDFPFNAIYDMEKPLVQNILDGLTEFASGIAAAFPMAFTSVFMTDGHFNALSIFLFCFFGLALGYGIIRWITGTFRKET